MQCATAYSQSCKTIYSIIYEDDKVTKHIKSETTGIRKRVYAFSLPNVLY